MYICTCLFACVYIYIYMYVCECLYIHPSIHRFIHPCMHAYTHTHTNTHIHQSSRSLNAFPKPRDHNIESKQQDRIPHRRTLSPTRTAKIRMRQSQRVVSTPTHRGPRREWHRPLICIPGLLIVGLVCC